MRLPEDDEHYLHEKGYTWKLLPDGNGGFLILEGFTVCESKYGQAATDLLIRIPGGYNDASLDMFWVDPPLTLKSGGYPPSADLFEEYIGRRWQRFSRHLSTWRPGVDGLPMFLALIQGELQARS